MASSRADCLTVESSPFITALEFCPFVGATNLVAIASENSLTIGSCRFNENQENESYSRNISRNLLYEVVTLIKLCVSEVSCLAWSPTTNVKHIPRSITLAIGSKSGQVNLYSADLKDEAVETPLEGHSDCVNSLAYEPIEGQELATVGDDHSCKVWDKESGNIIVSFPLQYPGTTVCWHPEQRGKLMVAELGGRIRFYDVLSKQAVLSVECKKQSLTSADWCWLNHSKIGASAEMEWLLWDMTKSAYPLDSKQAHSGGCRKILWSKHHEDVFLTLGRPKNTVKVHHLGHRQPILHIIHDTSMCASWHSSLPICAVAGNKEIHFYDVRNLTQF